MDCSRGKGDWVAECDAENVAGGYERNEANAHLIAAAPDLYQALRDTVAAAGGIHSDNVPESARLALAKAEGRTP